MNFEKKFSTYNDNAHIQKVVAQNLVNFIIYFIKKSESLTENSKIISNSIFEIGCGTGLFTEKFLEIFSPKKIILNDIFDVEKYISHLKYDELVIGDIEKISIPKSEIVVSSSVLQWIKDLEKVVEKVANSTDKFFFSIYLKGNLKEIQEHFQISLKYLEREEVENILRKYFEVVEWREEELHLDFTTPLLALRHLKNTGVTGFENDLRKSSVAKVREFKSERLTYKVGYFCCGK